MSDPVRIVVGSGESAEIRVASSSESAEIRIPESSLIVGPPGPAGEDGVSPTVSFTTITGGHTMTVTDKDHPSGQSINIMDGESGGGGTTDYDDLTDKPSINGTTLSGNKTTADLGLGTYSKPSGGIPKTDLASAVQTSLGLADSALQSVPSTYRTAAAQDAIDAEARSKVFKNIEGTASGSIAASTNSSITVYISVPTGYRIFAINTIGFNGTNSDYLALRGFTVLSSNNQVTIKMRSMATQSTISYTISVWVTCAKSDLF